ncbi:MAG: toxin-antitoxin system HicB family antitoxin [Pirellulales bacterium]|nr:toxin-antitoxin system HicB family antitoxin [Pirellulales bacterium]
MRATPELHRNLSNLAEAKRKSLNSLVVECLELAAQKSPRPRSAKRKNVVPDTARRQHNNAVKSLITTLQERAEIDGTRILSQLVGMLDAAHRNGTPPE